MTIGLIGDCVMKIMLVNLYIPDFKTGETSLTMECGWTLYVWNWMRILHVPLASKVKMDHVYCLCCSISVAFLDSSGFVPSFFFAFVLKYRKRKESKTEPIHFFNDTNNNNGSISSESFLVAACLVWCKRNQQRTQQKVFTLTSCKVWSLQLSTKHPRSAFVH